MNILIVDDVEINRKLLRVELGSDGFVVLEAEDGIAALEILGHQKIDLIVSDILMPGMNGLQLCIAVRKDERLRSIPFIAFTSTMDSAAEERLVREAGVDAYVVKSGDLDLLRQIISELRTGRPSQSPPMGREDELAIAHRYSSAIAHKLETKNAELVQSARDFERLSRQHELLLRSVGEGIYGLDLDGRVVVVNEALVQCVGFERSELIGQRIHDLIHHTRPDGSPFPGAECPLYRTLADAQLRRGEDLFWRKDGSSFWAEYVSTPLIEEGSCVGAVVLLKDITVRRQTERDLRNQAALFDIDPDAITVRDLDGRIRHWSRGAEAVFGWQAQEAIGRTAGELFSNVPQDRLELAHKTVLEQGEWRGEVEKRTKTGKMVTVKSRWRLIRDEHGQPEGFLTVDEDVTEQRLIEAELQRQDRVDNIGVMAGSVAHDLNNVLAPIVMSVELFRLHNLDDRLAKLVDTIEASARRGSNMVKQILSFARGSQGNKSLVNLKHLINDLRTVAKETFPASILFQVNVVKHLWLIEADATLLYQAILNLCVNARDAMPSGGCLTVEVTNLVADEQFVRMQPLAKPGPYVAISVRDTGTGIPAEIRNQIFEPFFTTKELGKGTGLGLATVRSVIDKHGGFLTLTSEMGAGTEFKLFLPAKREADEAPPQAKPDSLPKGRGELILVVDDEASVRQITSATLEAYGYQVETANDGTEALAKYFRRSTEIQLLLTDMTMPYMDGLATIRALRRVRPDLPVIVSSGNAMHRKSLEDSDLVPQAFLEKPYNTEQLLTELANVLHGAETR